MIRRLRELELPLDEIGAVLHADPDTVRERLAVHRARLQGRAVEVQQLIGALDRLIEGKEPLMQQTTVEPRIAEVPELRVAVIADRVAVDDMFTFVPASIQRLIGWLAERDLECTSAVTFLREPVRGIENDSLDVEIGVEVPDGTTGHDLVSVRTYPAARAAVLELRGSYEGLPAVYEPLREWILATGLEPGDQTREVYPVNPSHTTDERDYVTRVCWPVR